MANGERMMPQFTLDGEHELQFKIREATTVVQNAIKRSGDTPIVINFSGGKDSLTLLDLVRKHTTNFVCCYAVSGIDFQESIDFAKKVCKDMGYELLISTPEMYKGGFFERLAQFRKFPTTRETWCSRDLKFRAESRLLRKLFGKKSFYKLNGVRRFESSRRNAMHISTKRLGFIIEDYLVSSDYMVFPILNWTNENVRDYLKLNEVSIPKNPLYEKYSISGCWYCPFYQPSIYKQIMAMHPTLYDEIIKWEAELNIPAVEGFHWLRDIKAEVLAESKRDSPARAPELANFSVAEEKPDCTTPYGTPLISALASIEEASQQ